MSQISSSQLSRITTEIQYLEKSMKESFARHAWEIGKRLSEMKDELPHGEYTPWIESNFEFTPQYAREFARFYESNRNSSFVFEGLEWRAIRQVMTLPESVDRADFVAQQHTVPSTGEQKKVNEMTDRELREVKKALQESERRASQAEATAAAEKSSAQHFEKLWQQAKNQPVRVETKTVEIVPDSMKKQIENLKFENENLKHGYHETKQKLQQFEMKNTVDFNEEQARKQREKLQHEADFNTLELRVHITNFLEKVAITSFMQGAIASADPITKKKLHESVCMLEDFTAQIKSALNGRKLGGVINE